jgi:hypothetical protein
VTPTDEGTDGVQLRQRARGWRLVVLSLALALMGCGVGPLGEPADPPPPLPADQLVFSLIGWSGMVPPFVQALTTPGVALYGDGRLLTLDRSSPAGGVPYAYQVAQADPREVAALVARAEASGLVDDDTDFGSPSITDMPVTTVSLHGRAGPQRTSVYAFSDRTDDDVSWRQRRARVKLRKLIDEALALPADAAPEPYRPEQVRVIELEHVAGGSAAAPEWPGPDLERFLVPAASRGSRLGCGTLTGPAAERAYAAARTNPQGVWMVGGLPRVLAVAALLPGAEGCDR